MSISLREAYSAKTEIQLANSAHILNIKREEKHFTLIQVFTICGIHFFHVSALYQLRFSRETESMI